MATEKENKTEKPTDRRLSEARKHGDIPRSKDLVDAVGLFLSILFFIYYIPFFSKTVLAFWRNYLGKVGELTVTATNLPLFGKDFYFTFLKLVLPVFFLLITVVLIMEAVQGGGIKIIPENIRIKWEKVFFFSQIISGLKKVLISTEALFELFKSVVKIISIGVIAYFSIRNEVPVILGLSEKTIEDILSVMGRIFLKLSFNIVIFLLAVAFLDYLWQYFQYMKKLKMSKQDIKDEFKQMEGDPQIKARQKRIQFQWAMRRMMSEVPHADVVITNPTHFAVALKYESKKMKSPKLLAKGQDLVAFKIREIALENKVPIVQNPPVARAVYETVEIGGYIPEDLFKPVAEILAYIYKLKGKRVA